MVTLILSILLSTTASASTNQAVQDRIDADLASGQPIVVHVVVALCDNVNQGIVKVPEAIGNGQDPRSNLYWGALYGLKTHLPRKGGWATIAVEKPADPRILERIVLYTRVKRGAASVPVYIVADAWDGKFIKDSLRTYLQLCAGNATEQVTMTHDEKSVKLRAGGAAHLLAYVGHNGLMEFSLASPKSSAANAPARSALILACASKPYFSDHLHAANAHPLLLNTGLMAPEAYTVDSAIRAWVSQQSTASVVEAAAGAYHQYQQCGIKGARRLFWGAP